MVSLISDKRVNPNMDDLTLLFFLLMIGIYLLQLILSKSERGNEIRMITILFAICSVCCIITDESLKGDTIGLLPLFPSVFILLHSIVGLLKE